MAGAGPAIYVGRARALPRFHDHGHRGRHDRPLLGGSLARRPVHPRASAHALSVHPKASPEIENGGGGLGRQKLGARHPWAAQPSRDWIVPEAMAPSAACRAVQRAGQAALELDRQRRVHRSVLLPGNLPGSDGLPLLEAHMEEPGTAKSEIFPLDGMTRSLLDRGAARTPWPAAPPAMPSMRPRAGDNQTLDARVPLH